MYVTIEANEDIFKKLHPFQIYLHGFVIENLQLELNFPNILCAINSSTNVLKIS